MLTTKGCSWCGELYIAQRSTSRFCSSSCRSHSHRYNPVQETTKATESIFSALTSAYATAIRQLSDEDILKAAAKLLTETSEQRNERKCSILHSLLYKEQTE